MNVSNYQYYFCSYLIKQSYFLIYELKYFVLYCQINQSTNEGFIDYSKDQLITRHFFPVNNISCFVHSFVQLFCFMACFRLEMEVGLVALLNFCANLVLKWIFYQQAFIKSFLLKNLIQHLILLLIMTSTEFVFCDWKKYRFH